MSWELYFYFPFNAEFLVRNTTLIFSIVEFSMLTVQQDMDITSISIW